MVKCYGVLIEADIIMILTCDEPHLFPVSSHLSWSVILLSSGNVESM